MSDINKLYQKDLVLISDANTKKEVFEEVGKYLFEKDLVNKDFVEAIKERETDYPTGIDLAPVADGLPNVAIPHTDTEYCNTKAIVFVKLNESITFNNMISPEEKLDVSYLFFIINNEKTNQTNVLSGLMDFMTTDDNMEKLDRLKGKEDIYEFLTK